MLSNILLTSAIMASSAIAASSDATTTDYTVVPIYPTSSSSVLNTVYVTTTIGQTASAATSTTTDASSYSVIPIEGLPPATTVTVYQSGSTLWTGTSSAPLGTGTGYPVSNTTSPVIVSGGVSMTWSILSLVAGSISAMICVLW